MEQFANQSLKYNTNSHHYLGRSISEYGHNFKIREPYFIDTPSGKMRCENNFWLGLQHNSESTNQATTTLVIEFNPNKCNINRGLLNAVLSRFFRFPQNIQIKSLDICRDFNDIDINAVTYDKNRKSHEIIYNTAQGKTVYLGKRSSNGRVKIYDKAAEQKQPDMVCTRWEATLKLKDLSMHDFLLGKVTADDINANLPTVYIGENGFVSSDDIMLKCATYAIKTGHVKLADFTRYYRKQITPHLEQGALFTVSNTDLPDMIQAVRAYLKDYYSLFELVGDEMFAV